MGAVILGLPRPLLRLSSAFRYNKKMMVDCFLFSQNHTEKVLATMQTNSWHFRQFVTSLVFAFVGFSFVGGVQGAEEKFALLVGCTQYPNNERISELWGPGNDVPLFAKVLEKRFGFAKDHITLLVGSPTDKRGPSRRNIEAAFKNLVERSKPGVQIVIMMNGHGTQLPVKKSQTDAVAPSDPELDGLDEVFLPADVSKWTDQDLPNAIRDDEMAKWLTGMKQRGASVWIVFDCCHSGTMTRAADDVERQRGVEPAMLGIPDEVLERAAQLGQTQGERFRGAPGGETPLTWKADAKSTGSITAFYAAQSYEKAPELPQPTDAPRTRKHYFGLLTFVLCQTLEQSQGKLTYRNLARRIVNRYRAERGSRGPTPLFDGDLNREVLGGGATRSSDLFLDKTSEGSIQLTGGLLAGLNTGTILAAFDPADRQQVLGYVQVTSVDPTTAQIESVDYNKHSAKKLDQLVDSPCRIVSQDLGDSRISLALVMSEAVSESVRLNAKNALAKLPKETAALIQRTTSPTNADWVLHLADPETAGKDYGLKVEQPVIVLRTGGGNVLSRINAPKPKVYAKYEPNEPQEIAAEFGRDVRKIFNWRNVWRVMVGMQAGREFSDIQFLVDTGGAENQTTHVLHPNQRIQLNLSNESFDDQWLTLLYLDADYGIHQWVSTSVKSGQRLRPLRVKIDGSSLGSEGFVVLSVPVSASKNQPDYSFLEQEPLGVADRAVLQTPKRLTPFQQLMYSAKSHSEVRQRAAMLEEPTTPQMQSWTWTTVKP